MNEQTNNKLPWSPGSWQKRISSQQVIYSDPKAVNDIITELEQLPPLVTPFEIVNLKKQLGEAALRQRFVLQGGDCAEMFADCHTDAITSKLKILLQMSSILAEGLCKPIVRVGRMAGQYAKPRSADLEIQNTIALPAYRGDLINKPGFTHADRNPDPQLMLRGYHHSALTLNYIRALQIDFYTSHEALHLLYEQPLTRLADDDHWYNLSMHFPWLGMRTTALTGGHVEYMRGIHNPIAIKISPQMTKDNLIHLINMLNPKDEPGRLTLIHRLGADKVTDLLPAIIKTVKKTGKTVLWICDPMHGNTTITEEGIKTRRFDDILFELQQSFTLHQTLNSYLGGVHFELTGENVTECIGGASGLTENDLKHSYKSLVDPRLNYEQALEMAMLIVEMQR